MWASKWILDFTNSLILLQAFIILTLKQAQIKDLCQKANKPILLKT